MSLQAKTVFITGSTRGIGRSIALRCAKDGANVVITGKTSEPHPKLEGTIHTVAAEVEAAGGKALAIQLDVRDGDAIANAVQQVVEQFGGIDVLVNNAGGISEYKHFVDLDVESWEQAFSLNVAAPFALSKSSWSYFVAQEGGKIINISSAAVRYGGSARGLHYVSAKAALEAMTVALAKEGASKNILVNAIRCGLIETDMHRRIEGYNEERYKKRVEMVPLGRPGRPEEVAALVAHLASEDGAFITGQVLTIAGGD